MPVGHPYRTLSISDLPQEPSQRWCERCMYSSGIGQEIECAYDDYPPQCKGPYLIREYKEGPNLR